MKFEFSNIQFTYNLKLLHFKPLPVRFSAQQVKLIMTMTVPCQVQINHAKNQLSHLSRCSCGLRYFQCLHQWCSPWPRSSRWPHFQVWSLCTFPWWRWGGCRSHQWFLPSTGEGNKSVVERLRGKKLFFIITVNFLWGGHGRDQLRLSASEMSALEGDEVNDWSTAGTNSTCSL